MGSELSTGYTCSICGEHHTPLPLSASAKAPMSIAAVPIADAPTRISSNPEQCIIDGKDYFLRGRFVIPIHGMEEPFIWGVWAKIIEPHFLRANHLWRTEGRENEPSFPGWLDSEIPIYGSTRFLRVNIKTQPVGVRPWFTLADQTHPLATEQREGITLARAEQIAAQVHHQYDEKR